MIIAVAVLSGDCTDCDAPATHQASKAWENGSEVSVPVCEVHAAVYEANSWTVEALTAEATP